MGPQVCSSSQDHLPISMLTVLDIISKPQSQWCKGWCSRHLFGEWEKSWGRWV